LFLNGFAAPEPQMVIVMAFWVHDPGTVPEWRPPSAPVLMGSVCIENKPASFHFRISQFLASLACHLTFIQGEIHMFCGISMKIINKKRAYAIREKSGRIGV